MISLKSEQILKAFIVLGVICLLVSIYIRYCIPYLHEVALQKLDERRINDISTLDGTIQQALKENPSTYLGEPHTVYISLSSISTICADLALPSLPADWTYHCVAGSTLEKTDGTGWLPATFSTLATLPVDPTNNAQTLNYYAFVTNQASTGSTYVITATLDSKKYLVRESQDSRNNDPIRHETGSDVSLWIRPLGLIGYWSFENIHGKTVDDLSDNNNPLILNDSEVSTQDCLQKSCVFLNGINNVIKSAKVTDLTTEALTMTVWAKLTQQSNEAYELVDIGPFTLYAYIKNSTLGILGSVFANKNQFFADSRSVTNYNTWHQIGFVYGNSDILHATQISNVLDGDIVNSATTNIQNAIHLADPIKINGRSLYNGKIDDLRLYDRVLEKEELKRLYQAESNLQD